MVFDSISSNINPSANVFVSGDFNIHHKDWLTYSGRTGIFLSQMNLLIWFTFLLESQKEIIHSHNPALLGLFLSSDASICSTLALPPLGNSDHVVVSVSIDFPSKSQRDAPFHRIAYDYSPAD